MMRYTNITIKISVLITILFLVSAQMEIHAQNKGKRMLSYLALGDSYTIGESVNPSERWPVQLKKELNIRGFLLEQPKIIAKTGWRTDDLLYAMDFQVKKEKYDLVSILIGVNNQYQGRKIKEYENDLHVLFKRAIKLSRKGKEGVFVLSIPDYGVTPFGKPNAVQISIEINEWNFVCQKVCEEYHLTFFDITEISRRAKNEKDLIAKDGLHPSGKMYQLWVKEIIEEVIKIIN